MEDNGGTVSVSNEGSGGTFSFYDNSLDGWCVLHISTKTDKTNKIIFLRSEPKAVFLITSTPPRSILRKFHHIKNR